MTPSGYVGSSVMDAVVTPGTKLAHPDSRVFGRISETSWRRMAIVAVPNQTAPRGRTSAGVPNQPRQRGVASAGQVNSPTPNGRVVLAVISSVYVPVPPG